jgi:hypothetical protein
VGVLDPAHAEACGQPRRRLDADRERRRCRCDSGGGLGGQRHTDPCHELDRSADRGDTYRAFDGDTSTDTYTTPSNNGQDPSYLEFGFDGITEVDRIRIYKDNYCGPHDVSIQYTTDTGDLTSRSYQNVSGMQNGFQAGETTGTDVTCSATSLGGTSSATVTVKIDETAPSVGCGSADGVWHGSNVNIACTGSDSGGSGLAVPGDASFNLSTSVAPGSESANASTGSHQVCDAANNCATAGPIAGNKIDRKGPAVAVSFPSGSGTAANPAVLPSSSETIAFSVTDGGSGVTSWTLSRYSAVLSGASCGSFSLDTSVGGSSGGSHTHPETLAYGKCYRWTLAGGDAVGNAAAPFTSEVVRLAKLSPSSPSIAFGSIPRRTVKKLTETLSNRSGQQLKLTSLSVSGSAFHLAPGGTCAVGKVLATFGSCTVNVTFTPIAPLAYAGTLTVIGGGDTLAVPLSGTGT